MSKLLTVFGATGNQGGSVIKVVLGNPQLSKIYRIRAITRDASKPSAVALKEQGVEVVTVRYPSSKSKLPSTDSAPCRFERRKISVQGRRRLQRGFWRHQLYVITHDMTVLFPNAR
jgi:NmrA-like family